jgi:hypothetical protein
LFPQFGDSLSPPSLRQSRPSPKRQ